jgi:hypothetical protein
MSAHFVVDCFGHYSLVDCCVQRKTPAKHQSKKSKDDDEPVIYPKLEDEIFHEVSKHAIQVFVVCISFMMLTDSFFFSLAHGLSLFQYVLSSQLNRRSVAFYHLLLCDLEICNADWFYCLYGTFSRYIWIA